MDFARSVEFPASCVRLKAKNDEYIYIYIYLGEEREIGQAIASYYDLRRDQNRVVLMMMMMMTVEDATIRRRRWRWTSFIFIILSFF